MIRLISADWLPAFHSSVAGLPRSVIGDHHADAHTAPSRIPLIGARASRDPCVVGSVVTEDAAVGGPPGMRWWGDNLQVFDGLTWRAMSQTKPESSRAMATQILFIASPRAERCR